MNCHEAQQQIFAERDGVQDQKLHAGLVAHVAHCADCHRIQNDLTSALALWRAQVEAVAVPDAEREWHAVRRRIRGGEAAAMPAGSRRNLFAWLAVPLTAAAAVAVALFVPQQSPGSRGAAVPHTDVARANSVTVPGKNASTTVYVDEKSGWLIVWASDVEPKRG
jgi:hypothetical protein